MKKSDFYFYLPAELIAQYPSAERTASRLLACTKPNPPRNIQHLGFSDLPSLLQPGDLLVFNNTKVIPARLYGKNTTGGQLEILIERILDNKRLLAQIRASHAPKVGTDIILENAIQFHVIARRDDLFELENTSDVPLFELLEQYGHMPLPPYITRDDETLDKNRYQTVYAQKQGAVAAPTAGLHFDEALLARLQEQGIEFAFVTLHVGAGTFQPVRTENIQEHKMHAEYLEVSEGVCQQVNAAKANGRRIIAVGTTSVRCLETATQDNQLQPYQGETSIFIYPGYQFKCVDALITNFHLSESTLFMLVSAFSGLENMQAIYQEAIAEQYRFFSYGDAMFLTKYDAI
jgi:S-adenosylmethionine:tRNA ribosyltransferase-isomerase